MLKLSLFCRALSLLVAVPIILVSVPRAWAQQDLQAAMSDVAVDLLAQLEGHGISSIAVPPFENEQREITPIGIAVSEHLAIGFLRANADIMIVDRSAIEAIQVEQSLRSEGFVDSANAREVGRAAGVDALALGRITIRSQSISITVRIVSVSNASILAAHSVSVTTSFSGGETIPIDARGSQVSAGRSFLDSELVWTIEGIVTSTVCQSGDSCMSIIFNLINEGQSDVFLYFDALSDTALVYDQNGNACNVLAYRSYMHRGARYTGVESRNFDTRGSPEGTRIGANSNRRVIIDGIACRPSFPSGNVTIAIKYNRRDAGDSNRFQRSGADFSYAISSSR